MYEKLIKRLKEHKARNGLTWQQIADGCGLSYSYVSKIGCGEISNPTIKNIEIIDEYLNSYKAAA